MNNERCEECAYFHSLAANPEDHLSGGLCRIRHPTVHPDGKTRWPIVDITDWCGEFIDHEDFDCR